jgi:pilus assembly protein Flp/PilA
MDEIAAPDFTVEENNKDQKGASLVEYALLVALIAIVAIAAVRSLGTSISKQFSTVHTTISG